MGKLVNNSHFTELFLFWDDPTKASSSFPYRQTNIYVHTPRDMLWVTSNAWWEHSNTSGDPHSLLSAGNWFQGAQINAAALWGQHQVSEEGTTHTELTLSRWAAAPSRWCSTHHTWKGIPSPPWHPSCKLCQWLPYLPQTEQCWLFCARLLRSLWGQKAGPGSFIMSKLIATQHKDISSTTGWRNFPPREERSNKFSILSSSLPKVMLACSCRFPC